MAESQVAYIYGNNISAIKDSLSDKRFLAYLKKAGLMKLMHLIYIYTMLEYLKHSYFHCIY